MNSQSSRHEMMATDKKTLFYIMLTDPSASNGVQTAATNPLIDDETLA